MPPRPNRKGKIAQPFAPRYDARELQTILRFLAGYQRGLISAIDGLIEFYGSGPLDRKAQRHIDSYVWGASAIRRAAYAACQRQPHLLTMSDKEFRCILHQWKLPHKVLLMLGQDDNYATMPTVLEGKHSIGQVLENTLLENLETHLMKLSSG